MANEVSHRHSATGETLYFTIRNTARQMWNTAGTPNFETLTVANWGDYDVALSESPASSYFFAGTFPAISGNMVAGWYWVDVFKRAGGSPAISDVLQASYFGYWDGTTFKWWADDTVALGGDVQSATDLKDFADDGYDPATNKVQGVVLTDTLTTYTGNTPQTGDAYAKVDTEIATILSDIATLAAYVDTEVAAIKAKTDNLPTDPADASDIAALLATITGYIDTEIAAILAAVDTEVAAIKAVTDAIGATGTGLSAVPWNAAWDAEVQSEVQDAIEANHLDHLLAADYDPSSKPGTATALLNELVENDGGVSRFTANALEQAPSGSAGSVVLGPEYA